MPSYDYECKACGHAFEAFQTMSEEPLVECPSCNQETLRRLIGGGMGIIFKGSGFYVNDSRSSKSSAGSNSNNGTADRSDSKTGESTSSGSDSSTGGSGGDASGSKSA